jgi:hypothetical protein
MEIVESIRKTVTPGSSYEYTVLREVAFNGGFEFYESWF